MVSVRTQPQYVLPLSVRTGFTRSPLGLSPSVSVTSLATPRGLYPSSVSHRRSYLYPGRFGRGPRRVWTVSCTRSHLEDSSILPGGLLPSYGGFRLPSPRPTKDVPRRTRGAPFLRGGLRRSKDRFKPPKPLPRSPGFGRSGSTDLTVVSNGFGVDTRVRTRPGISISHQVRTGREFLETNERECSRPH